MEYTEIKSIYDNQKQITKLKHSLIKWQVVLVVLIVFFLLMIYLLANEIKCKKTALNNELILKEQLINKQKELNEINRVLFSEYNLKQEIIRQEILFPEIVLKQAKLETNNFKSNVFLSKNNLFGFQNDFKIYEFDNWIECVNFYKILQDRYYKGSRTDENEYYKWLKSHKFAFDGRYNEKLKKM